MEKNRPIFTINMPINITFGDIENVIITALEGGIGYWAVLDNDTELFNTFYERNVGKSFSDADFLTTGEIASKIIVDNKEVVLFDTEDEDTKWYLNLEKLKKGIEMFMHHRSVNTLDNIDSIDADMIIQFALFSELVYG